MGEGTDLHILLGLSLAFRVCMTRGFTLIEILISTVILLSGILAVASVFAFTTTANLDTRQRTIANSILSDKMETFRSAPLTSPIWSVGGSLQPQSTMNGFVEYVGLTTNGTITVSPTDSRLPYMCIWQVSGSDPRMVTVIVYAQRAGVTRRRLELIRATTALSAKF